MFLLLYLLGVSQMHTYALEKPKQVVSFTSQIDS